MHEGRHYSLYGDHLINFLKDAVFMASSLKVAPEA